MKNLTLRPYSCLMKTKWDTINLGRVEVHLHPIQVFRHQGARNISNNKNCNKITHLRQRKLNAPFTKLFFPNRSALFEHKTIHRDLDSLQPVPWNVRPIWEDENGTIDYNLKKTYEQHRHIILRSNKNVNQVDIKSVYNFSLNEDFSLDDLMRHIETIYNNTNYAFKLNLSFGIILRHIHTLAFRYFIPYYNQNIFNVPILISNREDLRLLRERLDEMDIRAYMLRQMENTAWKLWCVTNVNVEIYITSFPLGHLSCPLPSF